MESIDDTQLMQSSWSVVRFEPFHISNHMIGILILKIWNFDETFYILNYMFGMLLLKIDFIFKSN